jgi:CGNR zinc finger/Putative stress-induced transcription regulator
VDFGHYAESAAELVSADLESVEALQDYLVDRDWLRPNVCANDLRLLRRFQADLHAVVDDSAAGEDKAVVRRLNDLLVQHPVRPRISGHDTGTWHLHVNDRNDSVASVLIGEALFGMTLAVTELGADRFGWCAADSCGNAFFDGTANHSKRFCSTRCATRTNVAAHRQRRAPSA